MPDEPMLRALARAALAEARLPLKRPDRIWGGHGQGSECIICQRRIPKEEAELEIEFDPDTHAEAARHYIHMRCFAAWEFERTKPGPRSD